MLGGIRLSPNLRALGSIASGGGGFAIDLPVPQGTAIGINLCIEEVYWQNLSMASATAPWRQVKGET
jgi:hypothetical protein